MKLIVFEGLDGSGKTSLIKSIRQKLTKHGLPVITLAGLGSSTIGGPICSLFLTHDGLDNFIKFCLSLANMYQI